MLERYLSWLLRLVPRTVRNGLGQDLQEFWRAQRTEPRYRGFVGRVRFVISITFDALRLAVRRSSSARSGHSYRRTPPLYSAFLRDVRYGVRLLRRAPTYTLVSVIIMAVGIGATTSVFAVLRGVLLKPLPYHQSENLVSIARSSSDGSTDAVAWPDFRDWRAQASGFSGMIAYTETGGALQRDNSAIALNGVYVTRDIFEVLGVPLLFGRTFSVEEMTFNGPDAIILSHELWTGTFGADSAVIGRAIVLDGEGVPVVGVAQPEFGFPNREVDYWAPLHEDRLLQEAGLPVGRRTLAFLNVLARVDPNIPRATIEAEFAGLVGNIDRDEGTYRDGYTVRVTGLRELIVGNVRTTLIFVFGAVALVLLVASTNVAGLALGRALGRGREMGVRLSLGASRMRIAGQVLTENLVLSFVAGLTGVVCAVILLRFVEAFAPPGLPRVDEIVPDVTLLLFGVGVTVVSGVLLGAFPAVQVLTGRNVARMGGTRSITAGRGAQRVQELLVMGQVALAVVLLAGAVLLGRSYLRLNGVERGFESDGIVVALVTPSFGEDADERIDAFYRELLQRVGELPGVTRVTSTYSPPFAGNGFRLSLAAEQQENLDEDQERQWIETIVVRERYFETMGIPFITGRDFDNSDRAGREAVAIVNRTLADRYWPGEEAVGKRLIHTDGISGSMDSFNRRYFPREYTVVGVVGDTRDRELESEPRPTLYRPHTQVVWPTQYLVMAVQPGIPSLAAPIREAVWSLDPAVPVQTIRTLNSHILDTVALPRFRAFFFSGFAAVAFMLSAVGVYSVIALSVARRRREIGIRMALGANTQRVVRQTLVSGGRIAAAGGIAGLVLALVSGRMLSAMLYEITPSDPATYLLVMGSIAVITFAACAVPAARAGKMDPVQSLTLDE